MNWTPIQEITDKLKDGKTYRCMVRCPRLGYACDMDYSNGRFYHAIGRILPYMQPSHVLTDKEGFPEKQ